METYSQNEYLCSEVTFKEEPLSDVENGPYIGNNEECKMRGTRENVPGHIESKHCVDFIHEKTKREVFNLSGKHFGVLLLCPRCPVGFKYGLRGSGMKYLMRHVHDFHKSVKSHCISVIRHKYGTVLSSTQTETRKEKERKEAGLREGGRKKRKRKDQKESGARQTRKVVRSLGPGFRNL